MHGYRWSRQDILLSVALGCLVGGLGLAPHLYFSMNANEFTFFHSAFDEATYTLGWMRDTLRTTRLLSGIGFGTVHALGGFSMDAALVLSDFVFPSLAFIAAYFAAGQVTRSPALRSLLAVLLVFANDFFSLGSSVVWPSGLGLRQFSDVVSNFGTDLVPPYETSFLAIFRTPEPQVSFSVVCIVLGLLARLAQAQNAVAPVTAACLALSVATLPFGYTFLTFPVLLIATGMIAVFAASRLWLATASAAVGVMLGLCLLVWLTFLLDTDVQSSAGLAEALSFQSRLPVVTPAILGSVVAGASLVAWLVRKRRADATSLLALGCVLTPLIISNQQVVTGVMVSARDWERTSSYPILVFGIVIAISLTGKLRAPGWAGGRWAIAGVSCLIAAILLRAQFLVVDAWMPVNAASLATSRGIAQLPPLDREASVLLENAGLGPLVQLRQGASVDVVLDFYQVGIYLVPNLAPDATIAPPSPYEEMVFEYWLRSGISPEEAEAALSTEVARRAGLFSYYLFSFRDGWYPSTDGRATRAIELQRSIGPIVERYTQFLDPYNRRKVLDKPSILVSAKDVDDLGSNPWVVNEFVGQAQGVGATVNLYRQTAR